MSTTEKGNTSKNLKVFIVIGVAVIAVAVLLVVIWRTAGGNLDVVGKESASSFDTVLQAVPNNVAADTDNAGWSLTAPDKSARFIWSEDYSKSPLHDVMLEMDAQPFLDAGLDPDKLPENYVFYEGGMMGGGASLSADKLLMVGTKLGNDSLSYDGPPTALSSYQQIVDKYRGSINYHTALDHYGVKLGDGNMFEWAKDLSVNSATNERQDKDIVFVLNPEPLIAAGVDPGKVKGWVYAQVPVEENGKATEVWKFLKPFDLK
jgi:hypothetical protein